MKRGQKDLTGFSSHKKRSHGSATLGKINFTEIITQGVVNVTPDQIDAIKTQKDPNSCYRPDDEPLYTITDWDGTELVRQTKDDVIEYVKDELATASFYIQKAEEENDEDAAFEVAKKYLDQFSALQEEETDEFI